MCSRFAQDVTAIKVREMFGASPQTPVFPTCHQDAMVRPAKILSPDTMTRMAVLS
ncbi:MAG: hypothetical protein OXC82_06340 [Rhodobacteraceae bacterium]|nr:hypothetical protein [Paracoccaceae bacterium]